MVAGQAYWHMFCGDRWVLGIGGIISNGKTEYLETEPALLPLFLSQTPSELPWSQQREVCLNAELWHGRDVWHDVYCMV